MTTLRWALILALAFVVFLLLALAFQSAFLAALCLALAGCLFGLAFIELWKLAGPE